MLFDVVMVSPKETFFEGKAHSVIVPGEEGVFEVASYHKRLLSRIISGVLFIDDKMFKVHRGVIKVSPNKVVIIVE
jgi:F0F1-type ATP synthase epsilon subunit